MMRNSPKIINRFPVLEFIQVDSLVSIDQLVVLQAQAHLNYGSMSKQAKIVWKKVKAIADKRNDNFKKNKKLYKVLSKTLFTMGIALNSQNLQSLEAFKLKRLKQLRNLQLNDNSINSFNPLLQSEMPELQVLQIGRNYISDIQLISQARWTKLKILILSENQITSIEALTFASFQNIEVLNFYQNNIMDISSMGRKNYPRLRSIDFGANQLLSIERISASKYLKMQYFNFEQNPILQNQYIEKLECRFPEEVKIPILIYSPHLLKRKQKSKFTACLQIELFKGKRRNQKISRNVKFLQIY